MAMHACRLEQETGIYIRFAIGEVPEEHKEAIAAEEEQHGSFLHIPLKVHSPVAGSSEQQTFI